MFSLLSLIAMCSFLHSRWNIAVVFILFKASSQHRLRGRIRGQTLVRDTENRTSWRDTVHGKRRFPCNYFEIRHYFFNLSFPSKPLFFFSKDPARILLFLVRSTVFLLSILTRSILSSVPSFPPSLLR